MFVSCFSSFISGSFHIMYPHCSSEWCAGAAMRICQTVKGMFDSNSSRRSSHSELKRSLAPFAVRGLTAEKKNIIVNFWPRIHVQNPGASWEYSRPDQLGPRARTTPWPPHINFKTVALAIVGAMRSVQCCVSAPRTVVASLARRASTTPIQFSIQKLQKEPNLCLAWSGARCDCSRLAKKGWSRLCLWSVFITSQLA